MTHQPRRGIYSRIHCLLGEQLGRLQMDGGMTDKALYGMRLLQHLTHTFYKSIPVRIVPEYFTTLDSAYNDVTKRTGCIDSGFA
jgi:hypothetical protein